MLSFQANKITGFVSCRGHKWCAVRNACPPVGDHLVLRVPGGRGWSSKTETRLGTLQSSKPQRPVCWHVQMSAARGQTVWQCSITLGKIFSAYHSFQQGLHHSESLSEQISESLSLLVDKHGGPSLALTASLMQSGALDSRNENYKDLLPLPFLDKVSVCGVGWSWTHGLPPASTPASITDENHKKLTSFAVPLVFE